MSRSSVLCALVISMTHAALSTALAASPCDLSLEHEIILNHPDGIQSTKVASDGRYALYYSEATVGSDPRVLVPQIVVIDLVSGEQRGIKFPLEADGFDGSVDRWIAAADGIGAISTLSYVLGEPFESGAIQLFDLSTGELLQTISRPEWNGEEVFPKQVALGDGYLLATAQSYEDDPESPRAVLAYDLGTYEHVRTFISPDGQVQFSGYGNHLAIGDGGKALIGAHLRNESMQFQAGAAYLYDLSTGDLLHKLTPDDPGFEDRFGQTLALDNGVALVGAPSAGGPGNPNAGAGYLFDLSSGEQITKLETAASGGAALFGWRVAIHEDVAAVTTPGGLAGGGNAQRGVIEYFGLNDGRRIATISMYPPSVARMGRDVWSTPQGVYVMGWVEENDEVVAYEIYLHDPDLLTLDFDGDGLHGSGDLAEILAAWGTSTADADCDGVTTSAELASLLALWGTPAD